MFRKKIKILDKYHKLITIHLQIMQPNRQTESSSSSDELFSENLLYDLSSASDLEETPDASVAASTSVASNCTTKIGIVYKLTNNLNGKIYIGKTHKYLEGRNKKGATTRFSNHWLSANSKTSKRLSVALQSNARISKI